MASPFTFQAPNYHMSEPFPIESTLASNAMNPASAGMAMALLGGYQMNRAQADQNYMGQILQQHQMAQGALGEYQANNARERLIDLIKASDANPGALELGAGSPLLSPLLAGSSQAGFDSLLGSANRASIAKILESAGKGAGGLANAGMQPDLGQMSGVTGLKMNPYTPPIAQAAAIRGPSGGDPNARYQPTVNIGGAGLAGSGLPTSSVVTTRARPGESTQDAVRRALGTGGAGNPNPADNPLLGSMAPTEGLNGTGPGVASPQATPVAPPNKSAAGHITIQNLDQARTQNPAAYKDILTRAQQTGSVQTGPSGGLLGVSNKEY